MSIRDALVSGPGYELGHRLTELELQTMRAMITTQYLDRLRAIHPSVADDAGRLGIENYHLLTHNLDHGSIWPRQARDLPVQHAPAIMKMGFFQQVALEYGDVDICADNLTWRLVRPHAPHDVGPVHADRWFWDIGYGQIREGYDRFKIWIAIFTEPGQNGLSIKPFSHHRDDWKHHTEERGGMVKPVLDENVEDLQMQLLHLSPGEMVMFHDGLLHGGVVNRGAHCRVSLEMTIFFRADSSVLSNRSSNSAAPVRAA